MRRRTTRIFAMLIVGLLAMGTVAACGGDDDSASAEDSGSDSGTLTLGYSAWPGWFPLAVAEEKGIFEKVGLDVELRFFADYLGSLDAMSAGQIDANTQTLNDTMAAVAAGSKQTIIVVNDNSTGNDAIICDAGVTSIEDLRGKTIAAEQGVVDHFLLLQGLASVGMTQADIEFRGLPTDAAAAAFKGGEDDLDCVGVFAPFTVTALERPNSKVLFSSKNFPGSIPDHIVVDPELVAERPEDMQKLVDAWYETLAFIAANPDEAIEIMAKKADVSVEEYNEFAAGTTIFDSTQALAAFQDTPDVTSLWTTARKINPFLVESGLTEEEAPLEGLFEPKFTQDWHDRNGG